MNEKKQIPISEEVTAQADVEQGFRGEVAVDSAGETPTEAKEDDTAVESKEDGVVGGEPTPEERTQEMEQKLAAMQDRLLRTMAELDNVRKRSKREVEDASVMGRSEVLREILPVVDSIDLALSSADPTGSAAPIIEGIEMVRKQFFSATERFGLKSVECVGKAFDPNFHEAVAQVPSASHPAGKIVEEMRKGYVLGERLLRAAMVVVSAGEPKPAVETQPEPADEQDVEVDAQSSAEVVVEAEVESNSSKPATGGNDSEDRAKQNSKTATLGD